MSNPFRYFNRSEGVIRLVVMMYVRYPLSLRNVEDLLAERRIDISHETVRFWWNRFGPKFAAEIRKKRVSHRCGFIQWRWHLDEVFVKINGRLCCLWRAVDHEGEVLETVVTAKRDKGEARKFLKRIMKKNGRPRNVVTDGLLLLSRGNEGDRQRRAPQGWSSPQQSGGKLASAFSTTRASHAAVPKRRDATEIQLSSSSGPQPFQPATSSRRPRNLQTGRLAAFGEWRALMD
jgi:putative transposase